MDIFSKKGVIPCVKGGLGNQLFCIAASYVMAKHLNCTLYIPVNVAEQNKHNIKSIDYREAVFRYLGEFVEFHIKPATLSHLLHTGYSIHESNDTKCFEPWSVHTGTPGLLMMQYYQYYPPLKPYEEELRSGILKAIQSYSTLPFRPNSRRVFLHIRRGDYLEQSDIYFTQPIEYYKAAVDIVKALNAEINEFIVCSDDMQWVKSQPFFTALPGVVFLEGFNEIETLFVMSTCHGGAICANSTFSWWGAFLGAHSVRAPVIVPKKWIVIQVYDLFPKEWIVI